MLFTLLLMPAQSGMGQDELTVGAGAESIWVVCFVTGCSLVWFVSLGKVLEHSSESRAEELHPIDLFIVI